MSFSHKVKSVLLDNGRRAVIVWESIYTTKHVSLLGIIDRKFRKRQRINVERVEATWQSLTDKYTIQ